MSTPLGVRAVINANATVTVLGGSLMPPPVVQAMADAATRFVDLPELHVRVGQRLAELTHNESAYVTSGAAAAITLAIASCITTDSQAFPKPAEIVMFASQRNGYDYSARFLGATVHEIGPSVEELQAALERRPACVLWMAGAHYAADALPIEEVVRAVRESETSAAVAPEVASVSPGVAGEAVAPGVASVSPGDARAAAVPGVASISPGVARGAAVPGVPVLVDAAAQIPPVSSLWRFTGDVGADAVIVSGGKGLRGPQASGLVLGKTWLVDRIRGHSSPNHEIGRGMKVGKEELLGLLAAVEWTLQQDESELLASYERIVDDWIVGLQAIPGVVVERGYPSEAGQPHSRAVLRLPGIRDEVIKKLWDGDPRIAVGTFGLPDDAIALNPQTLQPGQHKLVLQALHNILTSN
ncbi:L-seryl-tRNA(Ser) seleniumtransferase [Kribbella rubisoli]|uniref:L-seryl-tRNA(Ser) seleniumtransferase n=1 Tax=Kribbella rubisoli TaxID=3075929 RepID=A0A4Q7WQJ0_9ACTN|nr:hypothetical protein [Kribbella rubisoli]RZU12501.1 L-seryl-tRNA(Ser) seleniumtransferase [Kribbella rubisoli]